MRRLFNERARLVVYLEAEDLNRLTAKARESGSVLVEWARERLLGELDRGGTLAPASRKDTRKSSGRVKMRNGSSIEYGQMSDPIKGGPNLAYAAVCPHKKQRGEVCYKCDPKFGYPEVA